MTAQIDSLWPTHDGALDDEAITAVYRRADASARSGLGQPWLRVNFVSSVDGAATHGGLSGGLTGDGTTGEADKRVFDILRRLCDVVLVGAGTVRAEGYGPMRVDEEAVQARVAAGLAQHPVFAIVSGRLDLDPASRIFTEAPVRPIVVTNGRSPQDRRDALAEVADVLVCGEDEVDARAMVTALNERGLTQVHCEGGPSLFGSLLAADVVDELCLTVAPQLEAGDARRIAHGELPESRGMQLANVLIADNTLLLRYTRAR